MAGLARGPIAPLPSDLRPQRRHLDVVRHVHEPASNHVGHQDVHSVAANVDGGQSHRTATLESP